VGLTPPGLFENAIEDALFKGVAQFSWNSDFSAFCGMLELAMVAFGCRKKPTVSFKHFYYFPDFVSLHVESI